MCDTAPDFEVYRDPAVVAEIEANFIQGWHYDIMHIDGVRCAVEIKHMAASSRRAAALRKTLQAFTPKELRP